MKAAQEIQRVLYLICRLVSKSSLAALAAVLLISTGPSFGAALTFQLTGVIDTVTYNGAGTRPSFLTLRGRFTYRNS